MEEASRMTTPYIIYQGILDKIVYDIEKLG